MSLPTLKLEVEELGGPGGSGGSARPPPTPGPRSSTPMMGMDLLMKGSTAPPGSKKESVDELAASLDQFVQEVDGVPRGGPGPAPGTLRIESLGGGGPPAPAPRSGERRTVRIDTGPAQPPPSAMRPPQPAPRQTVGQATAAAVAQEQRDKSWDGFRPFSGGRGPAAAGPAPAPKRKLTEAEITSEKFKCLRFFENCERKGIPVSKKYDMKSSLDEMQAEEGFIKADIRKKQSIQFQGKMVMAAVTGLEFLNSKFDPFDVDLDGWGENISENKEEYEDVFSELHEKYKDKASIAPEVKLMFLLAGSATMVHMSNRMFKPQLPGMDDLVQHNPELANRIAGAAAEGLVSGSAAQHQAPGVPAAGGGNRRPMPPPGTVQGPPRAEMKGPDNFDEIMARVKRKNADAAVGMPPPPQITTAPGTTPTSTGQTRSVTLKPTVLEGLQKAERTPVGARGGMGGGVGNTSGRKRKAGADNVLKLEI